MRKNPVINRICMKERKKEACFHDNKVIAQHYLPCAIKRKQTTQYQKATRHTGKNIQNLWWVDPNSGHETDDPANMIAIAIYRLQSMAQLTLSLTLLYSLSLYVSPQTLALSGLRNSATTVPVTDPGVARWEQKLKDSCQKHLLYHRSSSFSLMRCADYCRVSISSILPVEYGRKYIQISIWESRASIGKINRSKGKLPRVGKGAFLHQQDPNGTEVTDWGGYSLYRLPIPVSHILVLSRLRIRGTVSMTGLTRPSERDTWEKTRWSNRTDLIRDAWLQISFQRLCLLSIHFFANYDKDE